MQQYIHKISSFFYNRTLGLLLIRVVVGSIFFIHGWNKVADMSGTITTFDAFGLTPLIAALIAWFEIIGGLALVFGIAPRPIAGLFGIEMLIAAIVASGSQGLGGVELEILLAAISFGIMLLGSGKYALYKMECNACSGIFCIKKNNVCVLTANV